MVFFMFQSPILPWYLGLSLSISNLFEIKKFVPQATVLFKIKKNNCFIIPETHKGTPYGFLIIHTRWSEQNQKENQLSKIQYISTSLA